MQASPSSSTIHLPFSSPAEFSCLPSADMTTTHRQRTIIIAREGDCLQKRRLFMISQPEDAPPPFAPPDPRPPYLTHLHADASHAGRVISAISLASASSSRGVTMSHFGAITRASRQGEARYMHIVSRRYLLQFTTNTRAFDALTSRVTATHGGQPSLSFRRFPHFISLSRHRDGFT